MFIDSDKNLEKKRYDKKAASLLLKDSLALKLGSSAYPLTLRKPYLIYEDKIKELIKPHHKVLEIGSGTGMHTLDLVKTGASIMATDISPKSLQMLEKNIENNIKINNLSTKVADMENLPFDDNTFDVVTCAGSLSYGQTDYVFNEIKRVLNFNGIFLCVDSLNNNFIYRLNRYIQYLKNKRAKMTILNMPTIRIINSKTKKYSNHSIQFFGGISFLMPILTKFINNKKAASISDAFDKFFKIKYSAFKFVLIAKV
jgi:ubiquinone/menaquinone biosynthesis C-methylase UbiE